MTYTILVTKDENKAMSVILEDGGEILYNPEAWDLISGIEFNNLITACEAREGCDCSNVIDYVQQNPQY